MDERIIDVANEIRSNRYKDAEAVFAAGSIIRGEGTPFSDLDLVVVYAELRCAFRQSFRFGGYPVEAFVHDPATLEYFFVEVDRLAAYQRYRKWLLRVSRFRRRRHGRAN